MSVNVLLYYYEYNGRSACCDFLFCGKEDNSIKDQMRIVAEKLAQAE